MKKDMGSEEPGFLQADFTSKDVGSKTQGGTAKDKSTPMTKDLDELDKILHTVLWTHSNYWADYQDGAMTLDEWKKVRDNINSQAKAQLNQYVSTKVEDQLIFVSKMLELGSTTKQSIKKMVDDRLATLEATAQEGNHEES